MKVSIKPFGSHKDVSYDEITIQQKDEFILTFTDLGARINTWSIPDKAGDLESIILGYENAEQVFKHPGYYYGATIGRVAGRIAEGMFTLNGISHTVTANEGKNHLHGGPDNMAFKKWAYNIVESDEQVSITFHHKDLEGTNGYPGNLTIQVTYTISKKNELTIDYEAQTDKATLFNPTNHVYFNLNGNNKENVENHRIEIQSDAYLPLKTDSIPTGEVIISEGTPFDVKSGEVFKAVLASPHEQIKLFSGFDHPFMLNRAKSYDAKVSVEDLGRSLYMKTEEPSIVVYTHQDISDPIVLFGHSAKGYDGLTLEAQKEPDAINQAEFSSIILNPDERYKSQTKYWIKEDSN